MKKVSAVLKGVLLLGALLILALTSLPNSTEAQSVTCEGPGHSCHAIDGGGVTHHYKLIPAT